jgi:WD40 repeat protein
MYVQDDVTSVLSVGPAILAGSVDGTLRRFDVRMGRIYTDELHHPVSELALTHDGLCVLAACLDSCLRLLDVEAGELLASYRWAVVWDVTLLNRRSAACFVVGAVMCAWAASIRMSCIIQCLSWR